MVTVSCNPPVSLCRERVVSVQPNEEHAACVFADQTKLLLSRFLAKSVAVGDEIPFPIPTPDTVGPEILVTKNAASGPSRYLYQAPIGYVRGLISQRPSELDLRTDPYASKAFA